LETRELPTLVPFIVCAFALALLQVPFAALWIERSLGAMNPDLVVYARSAGLSEKQLFWKIRMPCLRPVFEKLLSYVFCISLGEVALASIWLREKPLLSLGARRLAQSYDFAGASWIFVLTLVSAIFAHFVFSRTLRKVFP
ncbi:MAG: ABC transporter permease subunit, partial [Bdellovibrionota bacterium]